MQDLHHSDILTYALTRMAAEFARDKQGTLRDLQKCIEESHNRHGLGGQYEEVDDAGPGYAIRGPRSEVTAEDHAATSTKTR
jgi:hypothetical protein